MAWTRIGGALWLRGALQIGRGGEIRTKVTRVTHTQILDLLATDATLIAAPGAGYGIQVDSIFAYFDVTTTGYTLGTADLRISYVGDTDIASLTEAGWLDQTADGGRDYKSASPTTVVANAAVVLRAVTADVTGGNAANTLTFTIQYRIVKMAAQASS